MLSSTLTKSRYCHPGESSWGEVALRVSAIAPENIREDVFHLILENKFIPGGRILRNVGLIDPQLSNCFLFRAEDTRHGWADLTRKVTMTLMTGGGAGINYSRIRPKGSLLKSTGGVASGPIPLICMINELGRGIQCGGYRRSAIYASLAWDHPDILEFIHLKDWPEYIQEQKRLNADTPAAADLTNISVSLDKGFFEAFANPFNPMFSTAHTVYTHTVKSMLVTGEPGFQIDFDGQDLRNPCAEIVSAVDSDCCVLGSLNFGRLQESEVADATFLAVAFLLSVTENTSQPIPESRVIQRAERRLGLGIMGIGEWFAARELPYGSDSIFPWVSTYKTASIKAADYWSNKLSVPFPVAIRCLAPTGTTSMIAETSSGLEPVYSAAYERRYLTKEGFAVETVIDPVAKRLYRSGITSIETSQSIDPVRRIAFQARMQSYIDNAISSTVNLHDTKTDPRVFGSMLMQYLPQLRGLTCFPSGSRGIQPITPISMEDALERRHVVKDSEQSCPSGVCAL